MVHPHPSELLVETLKLFKHVSGEGEEGGTNQSEADEITQSVRTMCNFPYPVQSDATRLFGFLGPTRAAATLSWAGRSVGCPQTSREHDTRSRLIRSTSTMMREEAALGATDKTPWRRRG